MPLNIENTGRTMKNNIDPTPADVNYMHDGNTMRIRSGYWWRNTATGDLFMVTANDGVTATWKKVTLT